MRARRFLYFFALLVWAAPAANAFPGGVWDGFPAPSGRTEEFSQESFPLPEPPPSQPGRPVVKPNVVLVTWDGVRTEEFFGNKPDEKLEKSDHDPIFSHFWSVLAAEGTIYGTAGTPAFLVSNPYRISLPAYQSIMAGAVQPCDDNNCGRITTETLPERLIRELSLAKEEVAVFASWPAIALAAESARGTALVDAGGAKGKRRDQETFALALSHLKDKKPRFLYISLLDSDSRAHAGDYPGYLAALRRYDTWLKELIAALDSMGDYGLQTTVLVTTDHGRGAGKNWKHHGAKIRGSERIFFYARGPKTRRGALDKRGGSHVDIRPTIEALFGLKPCSQCGGPLAGALSEP